VAERIADTTLSLPIGPQLSETDAERVARTLVEVSAS
jgi:dTDP-4-amino-4,6-dideoxygalactose transaminase